MGNCSTFLAAFVAGMRSSADEVEVDGEVRSSGLSERSETSDAPIKPELIISPKTGTFFKYLVVS